MALKRPAWKPGTLVLLEHDSRILRDNALGDPHVRKLAVWLPPQYDGGANRRFPVLYDLVGFMGSGLSHVAWKNFSENVPERAARLIHEKRMGPAIIVFPDCFTALGGNHTPTLRTCGSPQRLSASTRDVCSSTTSVPGRACKRLSAMLVLLARNRAL